MDVLDDKIINSDRKKITDLTELRFRTKYSKDEYGDRVKETEEYYWWRKVVTVGSGTRFVHLLVDTIVFQVVIFFISGFLLSFFKILDKSSLEQNFFTQIGVSILIPWTVYFTLYTLFESAFQQTPGKMITKSYVINEYGDKPTLKATLIRSISRLVPFEAFSCMGTPSYGWHDKWSKTWVVKKDELDLLHKLQVEQMNDEV